MKCKLLALFLALVFMLGSFSVVCMGSEEDGLTFTVDVNERYTDISELGEGENLFGTNPDKEERETKKTIYISVLVVALVISVIVLVLALKRVPDEKNIQLIGDNPKKKE